MNYLNSLIMVKLFPAADVVKGKMVVDQDRGFKKNHEHYDGR